MRIENRNSQYFTAVRIVDASPFEVASFKKSFPEFSKKNKIFRNDTNEYVEFRRPIYVITGWDILRLKILQLKNLLKTSNEIRKENFQMFLQKNNAKKVTFDEFLEEVIENKV